MSLELSTCLGVTEFYHAVNLKSQSLFSFACDFCVMREQKRDLEKSRHTKLRI